MRSVPSCLAIALVLAVLSPAAGLAQGPPDASGRPRARDIGLEPGVLPPGRLNAITDVDGVLVGQTTVWEGDSIRTGVTAIRPHPGNVFLEKVPAAIHVGNGFGKLVGVTQVRELGEIETPILLTCTLCVWKAADALVGWMLGREGMEGVRSINPVVGETNDGGLNDIRARPIEPEHVLRALASADGGPVAEGAVGAGTGTSAFGWKGGIGTSSRVLPAGMGGWTVGVLVQTNFGGILTMAGAPVGEALDRYSFRGAIEGAGGREEAGGEEVGEREAGHGGMSGADGHGGMSGADGHGDGSIMIVVATDAPLSARNLERMAARAIMGVARTGGFASNGSGDYVIAFSTHPDVRRYYGAEGLRAFPDVRNDAMSGLFLATVEATEEAIYNSLLKAVTVTGRGGRTVEALPIEATLEVLRRHGVVPR